VVKLRSIQVLRAVAVCAVAFHHAYGISHHGTDARLGAAGVDLFFVISGFIMARIGSAKTPLQFLRARALRIFPLWWIALIPWFLQYRPGPLWSISSLSLWPVYGGNFHLPPLIVGWSLCFEMLFYAAFAVGLATRWWLPLMAFGIFLLGSQPTMLSAYLGSPLILEFVAGVAIARVPKIERLGLPLLVLAVVAFARSPVDYYGDVIGPRVWVRVFYWGVPSALAVYGALCLERRFAHRAFNFAVFLGDAKGTSESAAA